MIRFIYGTREPYITNDKRKLNEDELRALEDLVQPGYRLQYFLLFGGRIWSATSARVARLDCFLLNQSEWIRRHMASRFLLTGTVRK